MDAEDSRESMSEDEQAESEDEQHTDDQTQSAPDAESELSEEGRKRVHEMAEAYQDKPTVTLPGSHGTISGTAINDWLDDEGNPKFGDPDQHPFAEDSDGGDDESRSLSDNGSQDSH